MTIDEMMELLKKLADDAPIPEVKVIMYTLSGILHSADVDALYGLVMICVKIASEALPRLTAQQVLCGKVAPGEGAL